MVCLYSCYSQIHIPLIQKKECGYVQFFEISILQRDAENTGVHKNLASIAGKILNLQFLNSVLRFGEKYSISNRKRERKYSDLRISQKKRKKMTQKNEKHGLKTLTILLMLKSKMK